MRLLLLLVFYHGIVYADFMCTEEATTRVGNAFKACGIGYGANEGTARKNALLSARGEFMSLCEMSDDCKNHEIQVIPLRTECRITAGSFACYRQINFAIGKKKEPVLVVTGTSTGNATAPAQKPSAKTMDCNGLPDGLCRLLWVDEDGI